MQTHMTRACYSSMQHCWVAISAQLNAKNIVHRACQHAICAFVLATKCNGPARVCLWLGAPVPCWVRHVLWVKAQLLDACWPVSSSIHGINTDHLQGANRGRGVRVHAGV